MRYWICINFNITYTTLKILLAAFFSLKVLLDYYKIIEASGPIILFEISYSLLMVSMSLHFTMDENHFLKYPEAKKKKKSSKRKNVKSN